MLFLLALIGCEEPLEECGDLRCGTVDVPVDFDDPEGPTYALTVSVRPADGRRIGPLAMNYGGPGARATDSLEAFAAAFPALAERFDLVAVDPRGTEVGSPIEDCMAGMEDWLATEFDALDPEGWAEHDAAMAAWLGDCKDADPLLTAHMGTRQTVADFEVVRDVLGGDPFTWVGLSYGTILGQMYAEMHPDALRAVYLDGVARPGGTYLDFLDSQAVGFETVYTDWQAWCAANTEDCPVSADPDGAVRNVLAALEVTPVAGVDGRDITYGRAWHGILGAMYSENAWPVLGHGLGEAQEGQYDTLAFMADQYLAWNGEAYDTLIADYFFTSCSDLELPADAAEVQARATAAQSESPVFGAGILVEPSGCLSADLANDPLPDLVDAAGAPPIVLVAGENDPATPYEVGVEVSEALDDATLITWTGNGHVALFESPCVADQALAYLIDLDVPQTTTCP